MKLLLLGLLFLATPVLADTCYKPSPIDCVSAHLSGAACTDATAQYSLLLTQYNQCVVQQNQDMLNAPCLATFSGHGTTTYNITTHSCDIRCASDSYPTVSNTCALKPVITTPVVTKDHDPDTDPKPVVVTPAPVVVPVIPVSPIKIPTKKVLKEEAVIVPSSTTTPEITPEVTPMPVPALQPNWWQKILRIFGFWH